MSPIDATVAMSEAAARPRPRPRPRPGKDEREAPRSKPADERTATSAARTKARANEPSLAVPLVLLASLLPLGLLCMHVLMHRNGYYAAMVRLRDAGPYWLPGSREPIVRVYTGSGFVDYWLTVLVCFFASAVDGSQPELSVLCVLFAANMGPCLVLVYVESLRGRGGRRWWWWGGVLWFAWFWCFLMQTLSFGLTMPTYCIISLLVRPRLVGSPSPQPQIPASSIPALRALPFSMTIGYIIPTILISSRSFSNTVHQRLLAFWQPFPLWVAVIQVVFSMGMPESPLSIHKTEVKPSNSAKMSVPRPMLWMGSNSNFLLYQPLVTPDGNRVSTLQALARAVNFASYSAASVHWIVIVVLFISKLLPSVSTLLGVPQLDITRIFMPANPFSPVQITAMPQGVLAFLQYDFYIGILAALIWTSFRQHELEVLKGVGSSWWINVWRLFINVTLFGPGSTVIGYAYLREAELELMAMQRLDLMDKVE